MEEIRGTEALEREILDDSARKAERTAKRAVEDAERLTQKAAGDLKARMAEMEKRHLEGLAQAQQERISRLPLEKTRFKAAFIDRVLAEATASYLAGLDDSTLGSWCAAELSTRARLFSGAKVELRHRGVSPSSIEAMAKSLSVASELKIVADPTLPRRGIVAVEGKGSILVTLTESQIEEILLKGKRGELAAALLPTAKTAVEVQTR